ncbi:hypothetical protein EUGRSUZ_E01260 [Eucalyptus grandis]|uniref:GAGA-binding transcriptional activator n=3 Tax=Eucalyptus grandis TaxID=71139 RepID=A0A059C3N5_EUCGR|nr:hypothetical protein EUGRSUZ_E01260 [Eucalyptus grandis]KAK3429773.1 hypothetical protein EUGRSUZ_E01260 [Eucalyptus grandis]
MGTYSNRGHIMPDANGGPSLSHIAWFYGSGFFPTPKVSSGPSSQTQLNPEDGLPVPPIRSVASTTEPAKSNSPGTKSAKPKKRKSSSKEPDQITSKALKQKQPRKKSSSGKGKGQSFPEAKREKKDLNMNIDLTNIDFSGVPSPYCSCTGIARVCYKWGAGGWQSSCCTISVSEYPLPMSSSRPGVRLAGRKMSNGAYVKLLVRLASEGYDLTHPVDLKDHWARHGTNKFVTIK